MNKENESAFQVVINRKNQLNIPKSLSSKFRLHSKSNLFFEEQKTGIYLPYPSKLLKLYIEPTNKCNLGCRTCIRHTWNEPMGMMSEGTYKNVLVGLADFSPKPSIFFGGFGEPLYHPKIIPMIQTAKNLGFRVELITNGTLLDQNLARELIKAELDLLWVSIDGATPESYADIRLGATLPTILNNLDTFSSILTNEVLINSCGAVPKLKTNLGIAFVAMKQNRADLPAIIQIARDFNASHFLVSNVLPYTKEMCDEILYKNLLNETPAPEPFPRVQLPLMDIMNQTKKPLLEIMHFGKSLTWAGLNHSSLRNRCPFIESGVGVIGWDGNFSPCLSLMHNHISYYQDRKRYSQKWVIGNIEDQSLAKLWYNPEHLAFRKKVQKFDFAPCVYCGGCELAENNMNDCQGNEFPTCGGCLWAQGVIQCP